MLTVFESGIPVTPVGRITLPSVPASARTSREWIRGLLEGSPAEISDNAEGIISELVTNSVIHAESSGVLCRAYYGMRIPLLEVHDGDPRLPVPRNREIDDLASLDECALDELESGRGLALVGRLSQWWGYHRTPFGKCVWSVPRAPGFLTGREAGTPGRRRDRRADGAVH